MNQYSLIQDLFQQLESNRRLTLRVIEVFPEQNLFTYKPTDALRPFSDMIKEILHIEEAYMKGITTSIWSYEPKYTEISSKQKLLHACEEVRQLSRSWWADINADKLHKVEIDGFFGEFPKRNLDRLIYALENEIHHRGQGYIYLRLLGIEPPTFYER